MLLRVGSRGSRLALTQAELAAERLRRPGVEIALVPITTAGDRDRSKPFGEIGERGVFVKEIEEALLAGRIDVAVHSAKDMTSTDADGLVVGAYLAREDPRDALCGAEELRPGMRVGTASVRRRAQLFALEPTLSIEPLRGNIDTRLRKRGERGLDAIVLAACGLDRLDLGAEIGRPTTPRRGGGWKPSARWCSRSAAAASRQWRPITTEASSPRWWRPRTALGSSGARATTRQRLPPSSPLWPRSDTFGTTPPQTRAPCAASVSDPRVGGG
jgi:hypothetical protein